MNIPIRLGPAELKLIEQLNSIGATAEAERLSGAGLPTRRVESYHYTDLKLLLRDLPDLALPPVEASAPALRVAGAYQLMVANGVVQDAGTAPAGVIVGKSEGGALTQRDDVLVRLNSALARQSLTLNIEGSVDPVIHIDRRTEGGAAHAAGSARIFVADGASVTILETYAGSEEAHVSNHGTYIALGKNAQVLHVTVNLASRTATHFATNEYHLAEGSQLRTLIVHSGGALSRTQLFPTFEGPRAHADLTGLNLVSDGQHSDITMDASHAVANTTSAPLFKAIARGRSKAVFQGRLVVARDAQKTDAKLMSQGLMLSDEAEILSKPELEIYADDVVCGHGSTCGAIDDEALFYLTSRGISSADAETMLVRAFLTELIDPIEDEALHEALEAVVEDWLANA